MAKKKTFVLRIDPDVYDALEKWAAQEFRSANGQIEWIINKALKDARRPVEKNAKDEADDSESESWYGDRSFCRYRICLACRPSN